MTGDFFVLKRNPDGDIYDVVRASTTLEEAWSVAVKNKGCTIFEDVTSKVKPIVVR